MAIVWAACDAGSAALALALLPSVLLADPLQVDPVGWLTLGVLLLAAFRTSVFFTLAQQVDPDALPVLATSATLAMLVGTALAYAALVLFGAPIVALLDRTLAVSALLAALVALPAALAAGGRDGAASPAAWLLWLAQPEAALTAVQQVLRAQAYGAAAGAWVGAVPIPLDWDRPWQAWPLTLVYGSAAGYAAGTVTGLALARLGPKQKPS